MKAEEFVRPGDAMLYGPKGVFGWLISLKTWHKVAHCEGYFGNGLSVASRDGQGVNLYPNRFTELSWILRPQPKAFNMYKACLEFDAKYRGQGYDWLGLLRFANRQPVGPDNKQFCSEFLTRWYRGGGLDPFNGEDADAIAPFQFLTSNAFTKYEVMKDGNVLDHPGQGPS